MWGKAMHTTANNRGTALIVTVFIVALLAAIVTGMLQINTEEVRIMQNHIRAAEALAVAEAGLEDAFAQLRTNSNWNTGFDNKSFVSGRYTVTVNGGRITSVATSSQGQVAKVQATVTVAGGRSPYVVRIDNLKVNE